MAKFSKEGIQIPMRCKHCQSRKTVLSTYKDGSKYVECESCFTVLREVKHG